MAGELELGIPCGCEKPVYFGAYDWDTFMAEHRKFRENPETYRYPWADEPVIPEGMSIEDALRLAEKRYGSAFVLPIKAALLK